MQFCSKTNLYQREQEMRNKGMFSIAVIGIALVSSGAAVADTVTYWGYPHGGAPGGSTFSSTGNNLAAGGSTGQYGGFNPSAYTNLYWVIDYVAGGAHLGARNSATLLFDSAKRKIKRERL